MARSEYEIKLNLPSKAFWNEHVILWEKEGKQDEGTI